MLSFLVYFTTPCLSNLPVFLFFFCSATILDDSHAKNLNYKVTDTEYHLTSLNPESIVGAMQLWTFNTKTKELKKFVAEDRKGLAVKGTTIQRFNNYSAMKKIGNKTKHFLDRIESGGKIVLSKVLDEINTKSSKPTGRINEHTILLRTE